MPTTAAPWSLRYPVLTDTANVPRDLGYLAADTATALASVGAPPSCRVSLTANTPFAVGTNPIVWTVENWDSFPAGGSKMHSTTVNPERLTIRTAGRYHIHGMVAGSATGTQLDSIKLYKNGSAAPLNMWEGIVPATGYTWAFTDEVPLSIGDYLSIQVVASGTGTLAIQGDIDVHLVATLVSV